MDIMVQITHGVAALGDRLRESVLSGEVYENC